jgi:hypothetical protein
MQIDRQHLSGYEIYQGPIERENHRERL